MRILCVFVLLLNVPVNNFGQAGFSAHLTALFNILLVSSNRAEYLSSRY